MLEGSSILLLNDISHFMEQGPKFFRKSSLKVGILIIPQIFFILIESPSITFIQHPLISPVFKNQFFHYIITVTYNINTRWMWYCIDGLPLFSYFSRTDITFSRPVGKNYGYPSGPHSSSITSDEMSPPVLIKPSPIAQAAVVCSRIPGSS